ncbi:MULTISPECIES: MgtC/SapB family protein [unclassified Mesorhizobium]|uniref:MgtC/SapB family protein n=1 Tax=Mesorhizobium sp. WSM4989 TaxID=3038541 RepID=UPI002416F264|nr:MULTISPECIES: MgtC/SapB family protein [unclassified Mesorhizobium]MDG4900253.1 MgtC/SapB family protein [Mesorhizobium sp. WSM4962]MDG4917512.1 MgtC/SapB family protein [Mesorhizobium sp. WSM4989]
MLEPLCCDMPLHPTWPDLVARLLLTLVAGFLIGLNREARGHSAGLRTTILVGLAACVAMVQANMLLDVAGKGPDSFVRMDVLRFALGVLTGVGFIGGGAILRRGDLVTGVTTAATMWIMTMIGLAFGGGQFGLGAIATALTLVTLQALKWVDLRIPRDHKAILAVSWPTPRPTSRRWYGRSDTMPASLAWSTSPTATASCFPSKSNGGSQMQSSRQLRCWRWSANTVRSSGLN